MTSTRVQGRSSLNQLDDIFAVADREYERRRIVDAYDKRSLNIEERYSYFNAANMLLIQEREACFLQALRSLGLSNLGEVTLLDVGCGDGYFVRQFIQWGAKPENITGVELLSNRLINAHRLCPAAANICFADASELPFEDGSFALVLQATMLTSVLNQSLRVQIAREMLRVLRPGGAILSYDFFVNNPRNPDVRRVTLSDLRELFPETEITARKLTLAPPLARAIAPISPMLCRILSAMKILSTHYLAVVRKP